MNKKKAVAIFAGVMAAIMILSMVAMVVPYLIG